ncbi:MAG: DUF5908 family protein [Prolixibacteraceae bacterium]
MPIEIRELNIRVSVSQNQQEQDQSGEQQAALAGFDKEELIAECVEQVMELIRLKNER